MRRLIALPLALAMAMPAIAAEPLWEPIEDAVYLQEVGQKIATDAPITAVTVHNGTVYTGSANGIARITGDALQPHALRGKAISRLASINGAAWAIAADGLYRLENDTWNRVAEGPFSDLTLHRGDVVVAAPDALYRYAGGALEPIPAEGAGGPIRHLATYGESLYAALPNRLTVLDRGRWDAEQILDWGELPYGEIRDLHRLGSRVYAATGRGIGVLRGMAMTHLTGREGLPYEDVTCFASGFAKDLWIGTTRGAVRHVDGDFHYFSVDRWLPNEHVNAIACSNNAAYVATNGGLGIIAYEPYTLLKKSNFYERWVEEWGMKRLGFIHKLEWNAETGEWVREVSDNDVGYSSHYLTAMCFKYAVTKDPAAKAEALHMYESMVWSDRINPIKGFPARSVWAVGEKGHQAQHGSGGLPAEWHRTPDDKWEWKGDTSSDEIDAHYYASGIFYELVAETDAEKNLVINHLTRLTDHIVESGWYLKDVDGLPTRWGRWDPTYFASRGGNYARGLNGMEAMNYATTAYAITGQPRFRAAMDQLIEWGYPDEALRQKLTFHPGYITQFDDRLAFYSYFSLLRHLKDPDLRSIYMRSLERSWEVERIEHVPWFNFIYGVLTGNDCETAQAVTHLREWPLDLVNYRFMNAHRHDLYTPPGYVSYATGAKAISPRSSAPIRWDGWNMRLDAGSNAEVVDPGGWLDAYWMGRYYGLITAPTTDDPALTTVPKTNRQRGAEPYAGPERPSIEEILAMNP